MSDLDPKLTFDSFVVGPANRLAAAAARGAADSPGTSYKPLFLYSAPGLGKTHILTAIAHRCTARDASLRVRFVALGEHLDRVEGALGLGDAVAVEDLDVLLLDDVQLLTGQTRAQEILLRTLDRLTAAGGQVVLASDRPPAEINGLDARLLSRFSGGLIVDLGVPQYETRVAIVRAKAEESGQPLEPGVAEAAATAPLRSVGELVSVVGEILAIQDLEGRPATLEEVGALLERHRGEADRAAGSGEFGSFLSDLASSVAEAVEGREEAWRKAIRETIESAERQGFTATRLEVLRDGPEPGGWPRVLEGFKADLQRLQEIDAELERLGNPWPEAARGVLEDPDRLNEAEALLKSVRERQRPFPVVADGPYLHDLDGFESIAVEAAAKLVGRERPERSPFYVWAANERIGHALLGAVARTYREANPDARVAVASLGEFARDFARALREGVAGAWRERWWTVDILLAHGVQDLSHTERAQEEFLHLFEALRRRGARMMFVADRPPSAIESIDDRLRARFENGLVLELPVGVPADLELESVAGESSEDAIFVLPLPGGPGAQRHEDARREPLPVPVPVPDQAREGGAWFPSAENAVIQWPGVGDLLIEELD